MEAAAQVGTAPGKSITSEIKPQLHKVEVARPATGFNGITMTARPTARPVLPAKAPMRAAAAPKTDGKVPRLDKIIQTNPDGSNAQQQCFEYNAMGKETKRTNSYWNAATNTWDEPFEQYDYTWNDKGLILVEQGMSYGQGIRNEYKYNEQGLGIEQTSYTLDMNGKWTPVSKGEYDYDDRGNMTDEMLYAWDGTQWAKSTHNEASYDMKNRQISYTGYMWDGTQWQGTEKADYVWFDGPRDPDYVEGTSEERTTYKGEYYWINGKWQHYYIFRNSFTDDGRIAGQSELFYNRQSKKWCGGDDWDGRIWRPMTWRGKLTYDDHGAQILSETWQCLPDSTGWLLLGSSPTVWEYDAEGNRTGLYKLTSCVYDDNNNIIGEIVTQQTHYAYNAANKRLWLLEQLVGTDGTETSLFEEKYEYNGQGLLTLSAVWDWVDGKRTPSSRQELTYNSDGLLVESIFKSGNSGLSPLGAPATRGAEIEPEDEQGWVNSTRWIYDYDNGTVVKRLQYRWVNDEWTTSQGQQVEYDFNVTPADAILPEGYADPYKINWIKDLYADGNNGWTYTLRTYYYSETLPSGINNVTSDGDEGISVSYTADRLEITADGNVTVNIYGAGGMLVRKSSSKTVYIGDMPSGLYIVNVNGYKTKFIKK